MEFRSLCRRLQSRY
ncbi:MAG TPA: hypothetical protein DC054_04305 [Blastocatellia bacterium]|nr:hypothetical protein [Blastocatellia bacterium]